MEHVIIIDKVDRKLIGVFDTKTKRIINTYWIDITKPLYSLLANSRLLIS